MIGPGGWTGGWKGRQKQIWIANWDPVGPFCLPISSPVHQYLILKWNLIEDWFRRRKDSDQSSFRFHFGIKYVSTTWPMSQHLHPNRFPSQRENGATTKKQESPTGQHFPFERGTGDDREFLFSSCSCCNGDGTWGPIWKPIAFITISSRKKGRPRNPSTNWLEITAA